jgi:hypothetical protein
MAAVVSYEDIIPTQLTANDQPMLYRKYTLPVPTII